jgi:hypothetical protein
MRTAALGAVMLALTLAACGEPDETAGTQRPPASDALSDMSLYDVTNTDTFYDLSMLDVMGLVTDPTFDGVLYFGFPGCPWCQAAVPVLADAADVADARVYYVSRAHDLREGAWVDADLAMAEWFDAQVGLEWLTDDDGNPTQPNMFVPFVVHVRDGAVVEAHRGTVEGHDIVGEGDERHLPEMTDAARATLATIYRRILGATTIPTACLAEQDDSCG